MLRAAAPRTALPGRPGCPMRSPRSRGGRTVMSDRPMDVDADRGPDVTLLDLTAGMLEPAARSVPDSWQFPRPRTPVAAPGGPPGSAPRARGSLLTEQRSAPGVP